MTRSSMKLASSVTFSASTPRCSTTIFFTRSAVSLMKVPFPLFVGACPSRLPRLRASGARPRRSDPSEHRHAAVDVDRLSGDVGGLAAGEIDRGCADILAAAEPPGGNAAEKRLLLRIRQPIGHRRLDEAGRDAIDRDVAA